MRKIKVLFLFLMLSILLVGCGEEQDLSEQIKGDWKIEVNGIPLIMLSFGERKMELYGVPTADTQKADYQISTIGEEGEKAIRLNAIDRDVDEKEKILEGIFKNDKLIELTYIVGLTEEFKDQKIVMKRIHNIDKEKEQAKAFYEENIEKLEKVAEKEAERAQKAAEKEARKVEQEVEKEKKTNKPVEVKEKEERFDGVDQLLSTYEQAIREQWDEEQLDDRGMGYGTGGPYTLPQDYSFMLYDINDDGKPEVILGNEREDGYAEINELYVLANRKWEKIYTSDIRTIIEVYKDGTISESYGDKQLNYSRLDKKGNTELVDGYTLELKGNDTIYKRLVEPFDEMSDTEKSALEKAYYDIGLIDLAFEPIVQEKEPSKKRKAMSEAEVEAVVKQNLQEIGDLLIADPINDFVDRYYSSVEVQEIVANGLDSNTALYSDLMQFLQPSYSHLASSNGMDAIIQTKVQLYDSPIGDYVFFGPELKSELISQKENQLQVKVTKVTGPQDIGGQSYEHIYELAYVYEENRWKLERLKQIK